MANVHTLRFNGTPFHSDGTPVHLDGYASITSGTGSAKCACGWLSEELPSGNARRAAHKLHKQEAALSEELGTLLLPPATVAADVQEPEVTAPVQEEEVAPEPAAEDVDATEEDAPVAERAVPFTDAVAFHFWAYLGREATTAFMGLAFPDVTAKFDNKEHVVILQGPDKEELETAADALLTMWSLAIAEFKEWSKGDTEWLERPRGGLEGRKASYRLRGEFYVRYAVKFGEEFDSGLL